eukprot:9368061-Pyramimonas_sp.AAC.1
MLALILIGVASSRTYVARVSNAEHGRSRQRSYAVGDSAGNCNEERDCDLFFYQVHIVFYIIDRCIRFAAGQDISDKTMTS